MRRSLVPPAFPVLSPPALTAPGPACAAVARPRWWRRWVVVPLVAQLTQGITPEKISLSLAVGSLCAFFPLLGAATPLCLLAGIVLRLNQPVIQLVNGVTAPLYPLVVFGLIRLGDRLLGADAVSWDARSMIILLQRDPALFLHRFAPIAGHALLGWSLVAPVWVTLAYLGVLLPLRFLARRWLKAPVRKSSAACPPCGCR